MDEKKEKPKLIASARESVGGEGYFGAFLHSKYNLPRDYLLLPFPLGITAPELCCSSQDLQPSGCFGLEESAAVRSTHLSKLGRFVKSGGGAASASASGG